MDVFDKMTRINRRNSIFYLSSETVKKWQMRREFLFILTGKFPEENLELFRVSVQGNKYWNNFLSLIEKLIEIYETPDLL